MNSNITVNADDFGASNSINLAILECFKKGIINQTTIMVNMPYFEEAVEIAKKNDFYDKVGIHLNISFGIPLSEAIRSNPHFCDERGLFKSDYYDKISNMLYMSRYDKHCLREEIEAQFKKYIEAGFTLMHFDSHHHNHERYSVLKLIIPIAKKYNFRSCRISKNIFTSVEKQTENTLMKNLYKKVVNGMMKRSFETTKFFGGYKSYLSNKEKIKDNTVEIMVHPIIKNGQLFDGISDNTYEDIRLYQY